MPSYKWTHMLVLIVGKRISLRIGCNYSARTRGALAVARRMPVIVGNGREVELTLGYRVRGYFIEDSIRAFVRQAAAEQTISRW